MRSDDKGPKAVTKRLKLWMQLVGSSEKFYDHVAINNGLMQLSGKLKTTECNGPRWIESKDGLIHYPERFDLYVWDDQPLVHWPTALAALASVLKPEEYLKFEVMQAFRYSPSTCFIIYVAKNTVEVVNATAKAWNDNDFVHNVKNPDMDYISSLEMVEVLE